jgi:hypothetical protein
MSAAARRAKAGAGSRVGSVVAVSLWDDFGTVDGEGRFYVPPKDRHLLNKLNAISADCMSPGTDPLVLVYSSPSTAKYVFNAKALKARTAGMKDIAQLVDKLFNPTVEAAFLVGAQDDSETIQFVTYDEHSEFTL